MIATPTTEPVGRRPGEAPTEGGAETAARLQMATTRLARRLRRETGADLTPSQLSVMASIHRHGPLTLGELADCERVAPPTITRVVAKLEADGLVARTPDPDDRRVARVAATSEGEQVVTRARARKEAWLAERLDTLPARDRARLSAAIEILETLAEMP